MGQFFFWLTDPPTNAIKTDKWDAFVGDMAGNAAITIAIVTVAVLLLYSISASRLKIHEPADCFRPYTPMRWLWLELGVLAIVSGLAVWLYNDALESSDGSIATALSMGVWSCVVGFILALMLVMVRGVTPAKYRYRPAAFLFRNRGVKATGL